MEMPAEIDKLANEVIAALKAKGLTIATAESCTGGLIAGALTSVSGSSDAVYGGFVTYANEAKIAMVGVPFASAARVRRGVEGGRERHGRRRTHVAGTHIAVAVTGVAGPTAAAMKSRSASSISRWPPPRRRATSEGVRPAWSRERIREASVIEALKLVKKAVA